MNIKTMKTNKEVFLLMPEKLVKEPIIQNNCMI